MNTNFQLDDGAFPYILECDQVESTVILTKENACNVRLEAIRKVRGGGPKYDVRAFYTNLLGMWVPFHIPVTNLAENANEVLRSACACLEDCWPMGKDDAE